MREERSIAQAPLARVPFRRLSWSAIFGGTFFALGIMLILSLFGLAIGAAAAAPQGATRGVGLWAGIWTLVTVFVSFLAGAWLAARASSATKIDGRLHGLVTWALGTTAIFYFAVTSTTRLAAMTANMTGNVAQPNVAPGTVESLTAAAATWALIVAICGLIGAIIGGHAGAYREVAPAPEARRAA
jgi:hypothetical protein